MWVYYAERSAQTGISHSTLLPYFYLSPTPPREGMFVSEVTLLCEHFVSFFRSIIGPRENDHSFLTPRGYDSKQLQRRAGTRQRKGKNDERRLWYRVNNAQHKLFTLNKGREDLEFLSCRRQYNDSCWGLAEHSTRRQGRMSTIVDVRLACCACDTWVANNSNIIWRLHDWKAK